VITGLLAWYDESPIWLAGAVVGAAKLCDHIVAVDGAYALYPHGRAQSDPEQAEAILHAAYGAGIGCTIHRPRDVWMGNQIEKRSVMFELGRATGAEWFYVFDADDLVTSVPADVHERLSEAEEDVAVFTLWWTEDVEADPAKATAARDFSYPHEASNRYFRGIFRSLPGLRVEDAHSHYLAERDGKTVHLRGHPDVEPFLNLTDLRVQHRHPQRTKARLEISAAYDRLVKAHGLETNPEQWAAVPA
jgi:hypothetical protein